MWQEVQTFQNLKEYPLNVVPFLSLRALKRQRHFMHVRITRGKEKTRRESGPGHVHHRRGLIQTDGAFQNRDCDCLIDNDRVRVTQYRFSPGSETKWHLHEWDYVVIPQTDGNCCWLMPRDRNKMPPDPRGSLLSEGWCRA